MNKGVATGLRIGLSNIPLSLVLRTNCTNERKNPCKAPPTDKKLTTIMTEPNPCTKHFCLKAISRVLFMESSLLAPGCIQVFYLRDTRRRLPRYETPVAVLLASILQYPLTSEPLSSNEQMGVFAHKLSQCIPNYLSNLNTNPSK